MHADTVCLAGREKIQFASTGVLLSGLSLVLPSGGTGWASRSQMYREQSDQRSRISHFLREDRPRAHSNHTHNQLGRGYTTKNSTLCSHGGRGPHLGGPSREVLLEKGCVCRGPKAGSE